MQLVNIPARMDCATKWPHCRGSPEPFWREDAVCGCTRVRRSRVWAAGEAWARGTVNKCGVGRRLGGYVRKGAWGGKRCALRKRKGLPPGSGAVRLSAPPGSAGGTAPSAAGTVPRSASRRPGPCAGQSESVTESQTQSGGGQLPAA